MYDTVFLCLTQADAGGVDFIEVAPLYLDNPVEHRSNEAVSVTGSLNGLSVSVTSQRVRIKGGSLCKFLLDDNYKTLGRSDAQRAIEKLSDSLHLPMGNADVTRMDLAQNFIMKHPVAVYMNHLGVLRNADRLQEPHGLYYRSNSGRLCFYDKNREQSDKRETIPDLYRGMQVLRYERRYISRIAARFGEREVTGAKLYEEAFYIKALKGWLSDYQAIQKINDINSDLNFKAMKTVKQFQKACIRSKVEGIGGQIQMLNQIREAQQRGELTKKQALDIRRAVNDACQEESGQVARSEVIEELDRKVAEAVRFYR